MVDSEELHLCVISYFSGLRTESWLARFRKSVLKFAGDLGEELTHFELWPLDENARSRPYRYIKRNEGRFLEACEADLAMGVDFYSVGKDKDFIEAPLTFGMVDQRRETDYGIIMFHCKLDLLKVSQIGLAFVQELIGDTSSLANIRYGLVDVMQSRKYPGFYFLNSASSIYLTPEEEEDIERWRKQGHRFQTIVRDAYWGNILSKGHWGGDDQRKRRLVRGLQDDCGANILWIDDETLFFCSPVDILDCERKPAEIEAFKRRVLKTFKANGIVVLSSPG